MPASQGPICFQEYVVRILTRALAAGLSYSLCLHGWNCESTKLPCSCPMMPRYKVMVKTSVGTNTSLRGSVRVHTLPWNGHLCLVPVTWLLERPCVSTMDAATTTGTLYPP